jgi:diketogulonate reductase-like aldo/keto reductase
VAIPGATKESHAKENAATMTFSLTAEDLSLLDEQSAPFK